MYKVFGGGGGDGRSHRDAGMVKKTLYRCLEQACLNKIDFLAILKENLNRAIF